MVAVTYEEYLHCRGCIKPTTFKNLEMTYAKHQIDEHTKLRIKHATSVKKKPHQNFQKATKSTYLTVYPKETKKQTYTKT